MEVKSIFCRVYSTVITGLEVSICQVEVDVGRGLPVFDMSGYLSGEVKEAKERVRVAIKNSGYELRPQRITVNISPANLRKDGTGFDVPIAVAIMAASGIIKQQVLDDVIITGELSLNGQIRATKGILATVCEAKRQGFKRCIVPCENISEGKLVSDMEILGFNDLKTLIEYFISGEYKEYKQKKSEKIDNCSTSILDFSDIIGQDAAKRATLIAVCGMHNIVYIGTPGSGKTMLAKRIPYIMPDMTDEESVELTRIYSIAGKLKNDSKLMVKRPFRSPGHGITASALTGGGKNPIPGEITLADMGVLFLDEFTEYKLQVLESLRQPLEDKKVTITRLSSSCTFPADFMLVAAMNPCKCGYYPDRSRCSCTKEDVDRYMGRISRPLWDRFDISVQVGNVDIKKISDKKKDTAYNSLEMKKVVEKVRLIQLERFKGSGLYFNSQMGQQHIEKYCYLGKEERLLLNNIYNRLGLTMRGYNKILKCARTIADIEESEHIKKKHLLEAASYRTMELG